MSLFGIPSTALLFLAMIVLKGGVLDGREGVPWAVVVYGASTIDKTQALNPGHWNTTPAELRNEMLRRRYSINPKPWLAPPGLRELLIKMVPKPHALNPKARATSQDCEDTTKT